MHTSGCTLRISPYQNTISPSGEKMRDYPKAPRLMHQKSRAGLLSDRSSDMACTQIMMFDMGTARMVKVQKYNAFQSKCTKDKLRAFLF